MKLLFFGCMLIAEIIASVAMYRWTGNYDAAIFILCILFFITSSILFINYIKNRL